MYEDESVKGDSYYRKVSFVCGKGFVLGSSGNYG